MTGGAVLVTAVAWAADYPGYVKVENFDNITGGIAGLMASAKFTNNQPDSVTFVNSLYYSRNPGVDNYGSRLSGFIVPQETADYVFFVAADDSTSLYLSTDSSPANLKLVAADQGWQNSRDWTGPGGTSSGEGTVDAVFRRGHNPGAGVMEQNGFEWVGPFENRSDEFLNSPRVDLLTGPEERWPTIDANGNAVINLKANQKYYFELLYIEGSGGENTGAAWKKASEPDPPNGDPEISGDFLSVTYGTTLTFMKQPQSQNVAQHQPVTFSVDVLGIPGDSDSAQFTYEWLADGQPIPGAASAASYTFQDPVLSDNGRRISVRVTSTGGLTATSAAATLNVVTDVEAPTIKGIISSDSFESAKITFSEAVRSEAADPANYRFSGGLTVSDANFAIVIDDPANPEDPKNPTNPSNRVSVILFTSPQAEGASYDLTVSNVKDLTGIALNPNTVKMYANVFHAGILNYKRWEGGNSLPNLLDNSLRYANPTVMETRTIAQTGGEANTYVAGVYVDRVDGFFIPDRTTDYVFFISSDNDGYLYLSADSDPAHQKLIAADVGWQNTAVWTGPGGDDTKRRGDLAGGGPFENRSDELLTSQRAVNGTGLLSGLLDGDGEDPEPWPKVDANGNAVISLVQGNKYYFRLWHLEGDSGRAEITFKYADENDPSNGTASRITSAFIGANIDPTTLPPTITTQPANVTFKAGDTLTFTVAVTAGATPTYQWYKNQAPISGATSSTLTIPNATLANAGAYYAVVTAGNATLNSQVAAALTTVPPPQKSFLQDSTGMTVMEAENFYESTVAADGHAWLPVSGRAGSSGAGYLVVLPDSGSNNGNDPATFTAGPRVDYRITFNAAGRNYIWLRGGDPNGSGNGDSVNAGLDGTAPTSAIRIDGTPGFNIGSGWNWVGNIQGDTRASIDVPGAGVHTVNLWMREDGFVVDKVILTTDEAFTPEGTGPAESQSGGGGTAPTISISGQASGSVVITYTGTLESAETVNGQFTTVTGASGGTYTVSVQQGKQQFYRARQ